MYSTIYENSRLVPSSISYPDHLQWSPLVRSANISQLHLAGEVVSETLQPPVDGVSTLVTVPAHAGHNTRGFTLDEDCYRKEEGNCEDKLVEE